jgi:NADH-quinone oxidoreductase subunit L
VAAVGCGSVGLAALLTLLAGAAFLRTPPPGGAWSQHLWTWWQVGGLTAEISLRLDALALVFTFVITGVGFLIHLYSAEYMEGDASFARFFACMNLFVGAMLTLVLAENLLLLYLGWEGVGLCSYLLIGFWYQDPVNGRAARKAFIVTRVGDTALAIGLFLLFWHFGTLHLPELMAQVGVHWAPGSRIATIAALLLLGGAVGKSAQVPLQTWLPDAMAGPTPVSALIHAATMVTAGVYLIARTQALFLLSPVALTVVAIVGAATLLLAGASALVQTDIKRVLAYSTISQIGYMFLALGVGAFSAAIFHFMTHAFFKALLFLGAGAVILALDHEQEIGRMGGLRRRLPWVFATFLAGGASLAALPLVTAGFYSKDLILWQAFSSSLGSPWLWAAGLAGALLTAVYTFRLIFVVFFGPARGAVTHRPGWRILVPLVLLALLSIGGGWVEIPATLGGEAHFSTFLEGGGEAVALEADARHAAEHAAHHAGSGAAHGNAHDDAHALEGRLQLIAAAVTLAGILLAYALFLRWRRLAERLGRGPMLAALGRLLHAGWGFDALYDVLIVRPYGWLARLNRDDVIDAGYTALAAGCRGLHETLRATQNGRLRLYAMGIVVGAIAAIAIMVLG